MNFSRKQLAVCLVIIGVVSLIPKLYSIDFSQPLGSDELGFTLRAIDYSHGDFATTPKQQPGWSLIITPFLFLINSNNLLDYSAIVRILSLVISTVTILPMYLLARKFFDEKYSLVAAALLAFEPHLNRWGGLGYAEPLYNLVIIGSFYFILSNRGKNAYLSFILAGILWWVRLNGIVMIVVVSILYFINFRQTKNTLPKFFACIGIFFIVISPILIQRDIQYGDPFYVYYEDSFFTGDYAKMGAENIDETHGGGAFDYIQKNGLTHFVEKFIVGGIYHITVDTAKISFPYLIILVPFGMLFSLRPFDQDKKFIASNWIIIIAILGSLAIPYAIVQEYRFLFSLYPFLIVYATIPIQRVVKYGFSTFSFSERQKNISLVIVVGIIFLMGSAFVTRYEKFDKVEMQEEIAFSKFIENNLRGKLLDAGYTTQYLVDVKLDSLPGIFKTYKIDRDKTPFQGFPYTTGNVTVTNIYGVSLQDLISNGEKYNLKYIAVNQKGAIFYKFLDDVYNNEERYPYLIKAFDSNEHGFKKFKVKVFEIDYNKFHQMNKVDAK